MISDLLIFLADAAPVPGAPDTSALGNMNMLFMVGFMFLMMYMLMVRPQQKKAKELAAQIASLKTGDKVVTTGGIHGIISNIKEGSALLLKVDDNCKMLVEKSAIATILKD
jgi:preprotein translocase subunit YajC